MTVGQEVYLDLMRLGHIFEQSAIPDEYYSVFLADARKNVFTLGATYKRPKWSLDAAFAYYLMQDRGMMERITTDEAIAAAVDEAPSTTRAKLRGDFIRRAKERRRDFTVDWVHLKLNDQAQRTVLCKDPFRYEDERVQKLIDSL